MADTTPTKKTAPKGMRDVDDPIRQGRTSEDVVIVASINKDGEPDQSAGFEFLNPELGQRVMALQIKSVKDNDGRDHVSAAREEARDKVRGDTL